VLRRADHSKVIAILTAHSSDQMIGNVITDIVEGDISLTEELAYAIAMTDGNTKNLVDDTALFYTAGLGAWSAGFAEDSSITHKEFDAKSANMCYTPMHLQFPLFTHGLFVTLHRPSIFLEDACSIKA